MSPQVQTRCCACSRLLFCSEPDALAGVLTIKCPRCRAINILRPHQSPSPQRPERDPESGYENLRDRSPSKPS
ncbi:Com family DNA-binding transcriptional regulator [Rhodobacter sp. NTK016B]|uniref:Com family DNA-binding transcriptional regulator n=1 Tax=Rhodobacter sp. NTK016B TaxID=2759676 RepID=UPI001A8DA4C4|nr:Com family DNA-binding transcriptional regulator [Rhodobacter sp. NTK016B]